MSLGSRFVRVTIYAANFDKIHQYLRQNNFFARKQAACIVITKLSYLPHICFYHVSQGVSNWFHIEVIGIYISYLPYCTVPVESVSLWPPHINCRAVQGNKKPQGWWRGVKRPYFIHLFPSSVIPFDRLNKEANLCVLKNNDSNYFVSLSFHRDLLNI